MAVVACSGEQNAEEDMLISADDDFPSSRPDPRSQCQMTPVLFLIAGLACAGTAVSNLRRAPQHVGVTPNSIQSKVEEKPSWECHHYEDDQDDAWCQSVGVHEGYEFSFVGWNANVCADCWCCKRAEKKSMTDAKPSSEKGAPSRTETTTPEVTASPTPAPTESPEVKALSKAQVRVESLKTQADALIADAEKQGSSLRAKARERSAVLLAEAKKKSEDILGKASVEEAIAWKTVAATRNCVDLPGVELTGDESVKLGAVVAIPNITTSQECSYWCQAQDECGQSVFSSLAGPVCQWFRYYTEDPLSFNEAYNSSYCADADADKHLMASVKKVYDKQAWFPPAYKCAWAGEDCSKSRCCANTCAGNKDFSSCDWYTCYVKDDYFAGCEKGVAPEGWNGTALGGHPTMEVPKAKEGQLTQGTSLFCFAVVVWSAGPTMPGADGEGEVANGWKSRGLHIMQCEEHMFVDGWPTGSVHNIDSFVHAWQVVQNDGRWQNHDWIVKADVDAVFFPERLRWHIDGLRTPKGAPVYLRNTYYKFHFMGALEVMTKEALGLYFEASWLCEKHVGKEGGEDYWLLQCLEGIGVNYQSDFDLLFDKYAAQNGCDSDWAVAFHFYKSVGAWNECHDTSQNNWYTNHQAELVMK